VQAVQGAAQAGGDAQTAVAGVIAALDALDTRLADREQILSGIR
jgi:hypothetical protein